MLHFPVPKFSKVIDFEPDLSVFNNWDGSSPTYYNLWKIKEENLLSINNENIARMKTKTDLDNLTKTICTACSKREELLKTVGEKLRVKEKLDGKKCEQAKFIDRYKKNLAFQMEKVESINNNSRDNGAIQFSFTYIDKLNPEKKFSFVLKTNDTNYEVISCQPLIESLDLLTSDLCKSDDLGKFVTAIRRQFSKMANPK